MGDIEVETEVQNAEKIIPALKDGLEEGLEDGGEWILRNGKDRAQDAIMSADRVWMETLKRGFRTSKNEHIGKPGNWQGTIKNDAPHAGINEHGLKPGSSPSVQDIIPWVSQNLSPTPYGGGSGGSDGDFRSDFGYTDYEIEVHDYSSIEDLGIPEPQFNSEYVRSGETEDGEPLVWKSHEQGEYAHGDAEAIRNEVVWSRAQENQNWNLGPRSRLDTTIIDDNSVDGTAQEYVVDSELLVENVFIGTDSWEGNRLTRDQFMDTYMDDLIRINAIDYIFGNGDRHRNNLMFDNEGNLRAIDNGGMKYESSLLEQRGLQWDRSQNDFKDAVNPEELLEQNHEYFDRIGQLLAQWAEDEEFRQNMVEAAREVHGADSDFANRLENVFGVYDSPDDRPPGHFLREQLDGEYLYEQHLNSRHERLDSNYQFVKDKDRLGLDNPANPDFDGDDVAKPDDIDDLMDDMFGDLE